MTIPTSVMLKLATIGLSNEQAEAVADMLTSVEAATKAEADKLIEAGREKARARMSKWRETHKSDVTERHVTSRNVTSQLAGERAPVEDKTSNSEIEPQENKQTRAREKSEFEDWYAGYPHKVQRGAAERAFPAARKLASLDELKAGLARYIASKPADRQWQNPATWLNGKGWLDVPAPVARAGPSAPRINPTLAAARNLMEQFDAVSPSEIEGNHPPPRLVAISGR